MSRIIDRKADTIEDALFAFEEYDESRAELTGYSNYSYWRSTWNVFIKNKVALTLLILVSIVVLFTMIQPYLPNQKIPTEINLILQQEDSL